MSAHYLCYCKPLNAERNLKSHCAGKKLLRHWSGDQYKKLLPGDHVWIVSILDGRLFLFGHLNVHQVMARRKAAAYLRDSGLSHEKYHAVCERKHSDHMKKVDVHQLAPALRFESEKDRLAFVKGGLLKAQQLQSMRCLTDKSVALLKKRWKSPVNDLPEEVGGNGEVVMSGGYVMDPRLRRKIERAAVEHVTQALKKTGWNVESVEAARCGYDLSCNQGGKERHVEVKGTQGESPAFIITAKELDCAANDPLFELWIVVNALAKNRTSHRYSGNVVSKHFQFKPVQYRAVAKRPTAL